ncbi:hypothetical protein [Halomontanus rarus]|uniref:hypothetical protein n=1 Tax=Halomontanus rarus TaxID=3034020 RepID=UPI001A98D8E3
MARTHAEAYEGWTSTWSPSGPDQFVEEFDLDAETYMDSVRTCEVAGIDYLDVCTPTHAHLEKGRIAVDTGVDISLEKPSRGRSRFEHRANSRP